MEQLESAESHEKTATKVKAKKSDKSSSKKKLKEGSSKKETKYCEIHGHCAHSTEECRSKNKRYKTDKSDSKNSNENKTWKRNADKETLVSKKELAVLIKKAVKKEVSTSKENNKKRKSSNNQEGFLVECLSKPLDGFNCWVTTLKTLYGIASEFTRKLWLLSTGLN
jgi:hypothetical protein